MFGFLKDKLKGAINKFSKNVDKEVEKEVVEKEVSKEELEELEKEKPVEKKGFFQKIFGKKEEKEIAQETKEVKEEKIVEKPKIVEKKPVIAESKHVEKKHEPVIEKPPVHQTSKINIPKHETHEKEVSKEISTPKASVLVEKSIEKNIKTPIKEIKDVPIKETHTPTPHIHLSVSEKVEKHKSEPVTHIETKTVHAPKPEIKLSEPKPETKKFIETPKTPVISKPKVEIIPEPVVEEKKGFFAKIAETFTKFNLSEEKFEELFWELEVVLLENNVAVEVIDKIKMDMKRELMSGKISRKGVEELILDTLKNSIIDLFDIESIDLLRKIKEKKNKPYIIAVIGVNGSGKTTSIAKLTHLFQKNNLKVVLSASDTFRAAAIQQLEEHANRLNTKLIKHDYNSDPAAVAFDAIKYAEAKGMDVVIIDTAGRLHSNTNLMKELEKVIRVCKPDIKIFVGESITGNDCVEQAKEFDKIAGIDAIILAKADVDEKGGAAISVSYVTKKPILYLGTGQTYDDLKVFDSNMIIESLEL